MSQFYSNNNNLIYSDTDSLILTSKLDSKYLGTEIGKLDN